MKRVIDFDGTLNTFRGPIVDWCKSLRNSTVHKIQLLSSSTSDSAPLFVVVSLEDGSMYRLQRTAKWAKKQILPNIQDTIEKVSALDIANSHILVAIKFKQHYPDLLFLLRVCHGIQKHGIIFKAPHVIMDCFDGFFALALVLNVTRNCPPRRSMADTSKSRPNSYILLEDLWQEIYRSLQRQGYAFWERTIAEHTKGLARELIYRLARSKILQLFGDNGESINGLSVAASTVARIEALAEKRELIDPTVWDKAWDMHWEEAWKQHGPVVQPRNPGGIQTFASLSGGINTTTAIADGRSSGRAAGRAPVMSSPTGSSGILLNAILVGAHSQPLGGPTHSTMEAGAQGDGSQSPNHITSNRRDTLANSEVLASNVHHASITKKYDCTVNWLGSSCLLSDSNTYKIWTTPQECAIESAWGVAWSVGELYGRDEASSILKKDDEPVDQPQTQPATTGVRLRARTLSKAVTGIVTRASQRFSILLNGEHGQESPVTVVPTIDGSAEANRGTASSQPSLTTAAPSLGAGPSAIKNLRVSTLTNMISDRQTDSPLPMSPQPGGNRLSPLVTRVRKISGASSRLRTPITPTAGLDPISEASTSRIDLSATSPAAGITGAASQLFPVTSPVQATSPQSPDSSIPPSGIATPRPRSESTKRLRKHIITRWSNPEPYSDFEASFRDKNQERKYRENKESSCKKATQRIPLDLLRTKLQEVDPAKQAAEAWDRANSISSKVPFQQKLKALAQQEWETMVIQNGSTSFTAASESNWKNGFISAWERTWKESWAAAWTAVWKLSFREAISRGIEFGVDDVFDLDSKLRRKTYDQLVSSDPYKELQELLNNTSSLETLEQIHQWMKELGYLSELLQHSVPTLRDEYVEITVESKPKTTPTLMEKLVATEVKPEYIQMSHYQLQEWLVDDYINQKVHRDKAVHKLFLRGIEEVWESVVEMNPDGRVDVE